jgi:predicted nucleotidyltransferase
MDSLQESILKAVAYFDLFHHPVTTDEILHFMNMPCTEHNLHHALSILINDEKIFRSREFYSLHKDHFLAKRRMNANATAAKQLKIAKNIAVFLMWFPFIKGVAISGSLSKNVAHEDSDIDFFIITTENRLWLSKLFFSTFIKLATFLGYKKWFCLNYIIDETSLEVPEKNIFTATEIITLLPLYGARLFDLFFEANSWIYDFFPNHPKKTHSGKEYIHLLPKKLIEWLLNNKQGNKADNAIMGYCNKRWKKLTEQNKFTETGFQL